MNKNNTLMKFIELGASIDTAYKIYNFINENPIEKYLLDNFEFAEKNKNSWQPTFVLLQFFKKQEPVLFENVTTNNLGRCFKKIGILSGYRNYPLKQKTFSGYYFRIRSNIYCYEFSKFLKS